MGTPHIRRCSDRREEGVRTAPELGLTSGPRQGGRSSGQDNQQKFSGQELCCPGAGPKRLPLGRTFTVSKAPRRGPAGNFRGTGCRERRAIRTPQRPVTGGRLRTPAQGILMGRWRKTNLGVLGVGCPWGQKACRPSGKAWLQQNTRHAMLAGRRLSGVSGGFVAHPPHSSAA